jgi:tetratricopeptide (TPR) repeat protein
LQFSVLIVSTSATEARNKEESSAPPVPASVEMQAGIEVLELESSLQLGSDRNNYSMRLGMRITVSNDGGSPLLVERGQFRLLVHGKSVEPTLPGLPETSPSLEKSTLEPMATTEGWIWFSNILFNGQEPPLTLRWVPKDESAGTVVADETEQRTKERDRENGEPQNIDSGCVDINLNKVLRELGRVEMTTLGAGEALQVISVHRNLDMLMAWTVASELQKIAGNGTGRVVFTSTPETRAVVMEEFIAWLSTMASSPDGKANSILTASPLPKTRVVFQHISMAGFRESAHRPFRVGRRSVQLYRSVDDAVCAALTPLYRFVPVEQALLDLRNPHEGVRRAAMAGAVDRLTGEQAEVILEQALRGSESLQLEIASYLNLIPGKAAVETLLEMCLGENPRVAAVALRSLAGSREESAIAAMADVWNAGRSNPALQSAAVQAIVECQEDRWLPLVQEYVSVFLKQSTAPESGVNPSDSISPALIFLQSRDDERTLLEIREHLPNIRNATIQDMFLQHLMQARDPEDETTIRRCISQRLKAGQISQVVASAAAAYRDSSWTEPLLDSFRQVRGMERTAPQLFYAALQCASDSQLDQMIHQRTEFSLAHRGELLQHLARVNHAQWKRMAEELLSSPHELSSGVIQLLSQDASEESLLILRTRLEAYVATLEGTPDASVEGQRFFTALLAPVSMLVHPECRRLMNRLSRSPNTFVGERARSAMADASRQSPAARLLTASRIQRQEGKEADADEALQVCFELDPLLPELYVIRASTMMHRSRFRRSMEDLRQADRLSPEDIEVQSMMALVMVRLDEIEPGLELADKVIALAPGDWVSVYNGACTFARATESAVPTPEAKQAYADRAIALLKTSAELKFDETEHLLKDADLTSLHTHPDWKRVVELVEANREPSSPVTPKEAP